MTPAHMERFSDAEFDGTGVPPTAERLTCFFDGLCEPINPGGVATVGWVVTDGARPDAVLYRFSGVLAHGGDRATNNVAEWVAFGTLLRFLVDLGPDVEWVTVFGDSQLVVNQFNGDWAVRSPRLLPLHRRAAELSLSLLPPLSVEHVYRAGNNLADALSEAAFYRYANRVDRRLIGQFHHVKAARAAAKAQKTGGDRAVLRAAVAAKVRGRTVRNIMPRTGNVYDSQAVRRRLEQEDRDRG